MASYSALQAHFEKIYDLKHLSAIASWDEAAMMPKGGGEARGRALSTLGVVIHELLSDASLPDLIAAAAEEPGLSEWQSANVREMGRMVREATALPAELVRALSLATSRSEQAWRVCRAANDWATMQPLLAEVVRLTREKGEALAAQSGLSCYNALLDTFEPGATTEMIDPVFADLKSFLPDFARQVIEKQALEPVLEIKADFSVDKQRALGVEVMALLGFDFEHGRLDISHHPFCGGVPQDVRITTRYNTGNFIESLMAVIHETGHAMYERGLPGDYSDQPVGEALSAGMHESQSLLMEMQACRTRQFISFLTPTIQRSFLGGESNSPEWSAENLYRLYTRVRQSLIRVDADEVTYPLHVILRYEIEQALIAGDLAVADLPGAWNDSMEAFLDLSTGSNHADGCLQDVHWPAGLFGYFPTYTIGALTAAQLFAAANHDIPGIRDEIGRGNFRPLLGWLREHVHSKGKLLSFQELLTRATGSNLDVARYKAHVQARYL
ncbi:MAG: carboxypeptidase M32 [Pseudomonadota bacterium]